MDCFCMKQSSIFQDWVIPDRVFGEKRHLLTKTLTAAEVPASADLCTDGQMRLMCYGVIFDGIYGKYKGDRRPRVKLPACVVKQVRRIWPNDIRGDDLLAAGYDPSNESVYNESDDRLAEDGDSIDCDMDSD